MPVQEIERNLEAVKEKIAGAAERAGRDPSEITLVAVTKTVPLDRIKALASLGETNMGESRIQEARDKIAALEGHDIRWHMIGHLQRNKVRYVPNRYHLLHSLDRLSLARELEKRLSRAGGEPLACLVQINTQDDPGRHGVLPGDLQPFLEKVSELETVSIRGLMTMAPPVGSQDEARPYFQTLRRLAEQARGWGFPNVAMEHLSMGMSGDFEAAIEEGATLVRVGRAIFGERE